MSNARFHTRTITGTALLLAMGVVLPVVFHAFPLGGRIFLPMHIPVLIAGLVLGPVPGLLVGAGTPVVSALVTGRPPVFYMVPMVFELATYGVVAGLLRPKLASMIDRRAARGRLDPRSLFGRIASTGTGAVVAALAGAMVAGRVVWLAVVVWMAPLLGISARTAAAALAALGAGWTGLVIQLAIIPAIVRAIERPRNP